MQRTAKSLGMVNFVTKPEELADETQKLAKRLSLGPTARLREY